MEEAPAADDELGTDARSYLVRVSKAKLGNTKPNGSPWDGTGDGLPDPFVNLEIRGASGGQHMQTEIVQDTLSPVWTKIQMLSIAKGDTLIVGIVDADALASDDIAKFTRDFTGPKVYRFAAPESALAALDVEIRPAPL